MKKLAVIVLSALVCAFALGCSSQQVTSTQESSKALTEEELAIQAYEETDKYMDSSEMSAFIALENEVADSDLAALISGGQVETIRYYADKASDVVGGLWTYDGDNQQTARFYEAAMNAGVALQNELEAAADAAEAVKNGDIDSANAGFMRARDAIREHTEALNDFNDVMQGITDNYLTKYEEIKARTDEKNKAIEADFDRALELAEKYNAGGFDEGIDSIANLTGLDKAQIEATIGDDGKLGDEFYELIKRTKMERAIEAGEELYEYAKRMS